MMTRHASLIATSNNADVIGDLTGSRRYYLVKKRQASDEKGRF